MKKEIQGPHQGQHVYTAGAALNEASSAMILVHGRGASGQSILGLGLELEKGIEAPGISYLAPQAAGHTWYPYSFLAPLYQNEPGLSSGLQAIDDAVGVLEKAGLSTKRIVIGGFSQGACLASEYVARNAKRYGGLLVFSGGLIGPLGMARNYDGSLENTPVFIGCSDRDAHIPLERVEETAAVLDGMGASVTKKIYPQMGHTIIQDEIDYGKEIVANLVFNESKIA